MAEQLLLSLALIAGSIILGSIASIKLKFPPVVMLILLGIILGPHVLGYVQNNETTAVFAEIGGILLLFLIGTEFNFSKIMKLGLNSIIVAVIELGLLFILVYSIALFLGFSQLAAIFIGLAISVTSTALTVKMLQDLQLSQRQETSLLVGVSIIEDIVAVFILGILSSLAIGVNLTTESIILSVVKSILVLGAVYFIISKLLGHLFKSHEITEDNMIVLALGLAMGLSFVATWLELSPAVGAFVAGNIIASLPQAKTFTHSIHKFGLFFISLFFLSIGVLVNPMDILTNFNLVALLLAMAIIGKFVGMALGTYFAGYSGESAVFAGVAMMPIGEMSLLIIKAGVDLGVLAPSFLGATAILVLVTALLSYPAILYNRRIYGFLDSLLPKRLKDFGRDLVSGMSYYRYQLSTEGRYFNYAVRNTGRILLLVAVPIFIVFVFYVIPQFFGRKFVLAIAAAVFLVMLVYFLRQRIHALRRWKPEQRMSYKFRPRKR